VADSAKALAVRGAARKTNPLADANGRPKERAGMAHGSAGLRLHARQECELHQVFAG